MINDTDLISADDEALLDVKRRFGVLFQSGALIGSMTLAENIALPLTEHADLDPGFIDEIVRMKLRLVNLAGYEDAFPSELSGGMKKRAGIARALALDPQILFLDELSAGLDPVTSAVIDELMVRTRQELRVTGVVVTHDMRSAYTVGDRIAMLYAGRIRQVGTIEEIRNTDDPVVRNFIEGRPTDQDRLLTQETHA